MMILKLKKKLQRVRKYMFSQARCPEKVTLNSASVSLYTSQDLSRVNPMSKEEDACISRISPIVLKLVKEDFLVFQNLMSEEMS